MLKQVLHFNHVSKELLDSVPKLKRGETKVFKSLSIKPATDPKNPRKFEGPFMENIPVKDIIWDENKQEFVEIAYCDQGITNKGEAYPVFKTIRFIAPNGTISIRGGNASEEFMYYYLMLSNYNLSNPNRDTTKQAYFSVVDKEAEAKEERRTRSKKLDALTKATSMSADEVRDFIASVGQNDQQPLEVLRDIVEKWADKDPADFLKKATDVQAQLKATVKRALDQGVITFDKSQLLFSWGSTGEKIITVARTQNGDHIKEFVETIISDKRYEKVLPSIRGSLRKNVGKKEEA